ncbi:C-type lectin mannose-binding isoform-like [Physella acuta]|uniref:C-type lectin mannose-binding isoform-like n=1 Tax=Physella acuta TaxID=109671 RepID=UPI0027DBB5CD|nr:C-type lectin mannose-binding isoform-like [Physella acuta]
MSNGTTVTYVWLSNYKLNFTSARDDCRAKAAHLYTPKTQEKLNIFLNIFNTLPIDIWIGLNDIDKLYEFVWDDDGDVYTGQPVIFNEGDPNNFNGIQRCVAACTGFSLLIDTECAKVAQFLCELKDAPDL